MLESILNILSRIKVLSVACGREHTLALTKQGVSIVINSACTLPFYIQVFLLIFTRFMPGVLQIMVRSV